MQSAARMAPPDYRAGVDPSHLRVLVADDDRDLCRWVERILRAQRWDVICVHDGRAALEVVRAGGIDLLLLDVTMPRVDGPGVLEGLRPVEALPVLVMSGRGDAEVPVLRAGADGFLAKPFTADVLQATLQSMARRLRDLQPVARGLAAGAVELDRRRRECLVDGEVVELTRREFDLLAEFLANPDVVHTREELLRSVWASSGRWQSDATVTEHVRRLRTKLGAGAGITFAAVRGVGYRLATED